MSALIGFMSGMGTGMAQVGMQSLKNLQDEEREVARDGRMALRDERMAQLREEAEIAKEKRLAEIKAAPMKRLGEAATAASKEDIPTTIKPVDKVSGYDPREADAGPTQNGGFKGDIAEVRKSIEDIKDPKIRADAMAQLERQIEADNKTNSAIIGPNRKRTPDEALKEAAERSKITDPEAAAAYEEKFGKPAREDRRLDQQDERERNRDKRDQEKGDRDEKRLAQYDRKMDSQDAYNQRREERLDRLAEIQEKRLSGQQDRQELQSQRIAAVEVMKSTAQELERTIALAKDPTLSPELQKMFEGRTAALTRDLGRYRKAVESFAGEGMPKGDEAKPSPKAAPPAAALEALRKDPKLRDQFIAKYGADAIPTEEPKKAAASDPIIGPRYTPPAGTQAAQALAEREAKRKSEKAEREAKMMADAKRRMEQEEEDRKKAATYRERNQIK